MENIFGLIICAFPEVIKLLCGISEKIIVLLLLFASRSSPLYDVGSISFRRGYEKRREK